MLKIQNRYLGIAGGAFAALLFSCATDGGSDSAEEQAPQQTPSSSTPTSSELANKEAELRAARESAGAAQSGVKSCFDSLGACMGDGGAPDQACLDKLKGCLPVAPPAPIGCPKLPEPTADDIAAVDDAVGTADDLAGEVVDFAGEVEEAVGPVIDDLAGQVEDAVNQILDGGIPLPPAPGAWPPGNGGHNKSGGARGFGALPDGGASVPHFPGDGGVGFPQIPADASIGGGELCGVPLPTVPVGALKACADKAAEDLKAGGDLFAIAETALSCVAKPFEEDIAKLCGDATSMCAQPDAPPNICAQVNEICSELTGP